MNFILPRTGCVRAVKVSGTKTAPAGDGSYLTCARVAAQCIHELSARGSAAFRPLYCERTHDFAV